MPIFNSHPLVGCLVHYVSSGGENPVTVHRPTCPTARLCEASWSWFHVACRTYSHHPLVTQSRQQ